MSFRIIRDVVLTVAAVAAIATALWKLESAKAGLTIESVSIGHIPATIFRPSSGGRAPSVLIAHGFAGSQQLMQSFALTLARSGFTAVTFDFAGHGRNPKPLSGDVTQETGATQTLLNETKQAADYARALGDGRLAILGHSMASDIVVRFAQAEPDVTATVAVSMFSRAVSADAPRNLLIIVGDWEGFLKAEALRTLEPAASPAPPQEAITYGRFDLGTARRAAFADGAEHIGVLYSGESMKEALAWLDAAFGRPSSATSPLDARGGWIVLLIIGITLLARPLFSLLPNVAPEPAGAGLNWRRVGPILLMSAIATPLILRPLPTHFLPVVVGDYLAAHFALYGLLSFLGLWWTRRRDAPRPAGRVSLILLAVAALACAAYAIGGLGGALDRYVLSFAPGPARVVLILATLAGTLAFFLSDEWLTRGAGAARGGYAVAKIAFLLSLTIAVALDFERLFFLVIIIPAIAPFFIVFGFFSGWAYRRTGHPFVGGISNALSFAWAIGVVFPLLAG